MRPSQHRAGGRGRTPRGGREAKGLEAEWKRRRDGGRAAPGVLHAGALRPLVSLAAGTVIRRRGSPARGSAVERNWHRLPSWPEQADPALPPSATGSPASPRRLPWARRQQGTHKQGPEAVPGLSPDCAAPEPGAEGAEPWLKVTPLREAELRAERGGQTRPRPVRRPVPPQSRRVCPSRSPPARKPSGSCAAPQALRFWAPLGLSLGGARFRGLWRGRRRRAWGRAGARGPARGPAQGSALRL